MDSVHQTFVGRVAGRARAVLDMYGDLTRQNELWAGTPDYSNAITQDDIDSVAQFASAGLTKQQLADGIYALELIRGNVTNALAALAILSELG